MIAFAAAGWAAATASSQADAQSSPARPTGLTATAGDASATLTWDDPSNATITHYEYQSRQTGLGWGSWTAIDDSDAASVTHTITGLTNGTEYRFKLRAVNTTGNSAPAPAERPWYVAVTIGIPLPAAPSGLTATAGDASVTLAWDDPSNATITSYEYQSRTTVGWSEWTAIDDSDSDTVSHTVTGLTNGTEHRFKLRAVNATGSGAIAPAADPWFVAATPAAPPPPPPPPPPTGLTAAPGPMSVTLTWDDPSNATITGYEYQSRSTYAWSEWTAIDDSDAATTTHTVTGLTNSTEYRFKLRAVNDGGASTPAPVTDPWYVAATPNAAPAAPTGLTAAAGDGSVALAWDDPSNSSITRYEYAARLAGHAWGAWTAIDDSDSTTTTHTLTGLTNNIEHRFKLRAVNATGNSAIAPVADPWYVSATPAPPLPAAAPNVVVISADDLGYNDVSFNGATDISTPNIDKLATTGVTFTRGYVAAPLCTPSRVGLLTGRYPLRSGAQVNWDHLPQDPQDPLYGLAPTEKTVAAYLAAAGYRTGMVGKWQIGSADGLQPLDRGFDYFYGFLGGGHIYYGYENDPTSNNSYYYPLSEDVPYHWLFGTESRQLTDFTKVKPYLTDALTDKAIDFITTAAGATDPWFLQLSYNAPHTPLEAPTALIDKYKALGHNTDRATFLAMVDSLDQNVGRVLDAISAAGERDDTLIFFLSDNGGGYGSDNSPLKMWKGTLYEGGIRVPFAASWPGRWPAGITYDKPVISLDIAATAMAMAGATPDSGLPLDGVDLDGYVRSPTVGTPHEALFWHWWDSGSYSSYAAVSGDLKLVKELNTASVELYDLSSDEGETTDLFDETSTEPSQARTDAERLRTLWNAWNDDNKVGLYHGAGEYRSLQPWSRAAKTRQLRCEREGLSPSQIRTDFSVGAPSSSGASGASASGLPSALSSGAAAAISVTSSGGATWDYTLPSGHTFVDVEVQWRVHNTDDIDDWTGRSSQAFTSPCVYSHQITGLSAGVTYKARLVVTTRDSSDTDHTHNSNTAVFPPSS